MTQAKERPILFSAPMVRAILDGRKTVTRRVCKPQPSANAHTKSADGSPMTSWWETGKDIVRCPYGQPGERLWVRETWGVISHDFDEHGNMIDWKPDRPASPIREMRFGQGYYSGHVIYRADGEAVWAGDDDGGGDDRSAWKPSIHMPRIACRILLEITEIRVERLQDISEEQAKAEGPIWPVAEHLEMAWRVQFRTLWESINGAENWNANPWVWVVEFKQVKQ